MIRPTETERSCLAMTVRTDEHTADVYITNWGRVWARNFSQDGRVSISEHSLMHREGFAGLNRELEIRLMSPQSPYAHCVGLAHAFETIFGLSPDEVMSLRTFLVRQPRMRPGRPKTVWKVYNSKTFLPDLLIEGNRAASTASGRKSTTLFDTVSNEFVETAGEYFNSHYNTWGKVRLFRSQTQPFRTRTREGYLFQPIIAPEGVVYDSVETYANRTGYPLRDIYDELIATTVCPEGFGARLMDHLDDAFRYLLETGSAECVNAREASTGYFVPGFENPQDVPDVERGLEIVGSEKYMEALMRG